MIVVNNMDYSKYWHTIWGLAIRVMIPVTRNTMGLPTDTWKLNTLMLE